MRWDEFIRACPEIGSLADERFRRDQLVMLGTIRAGGSPRICPTELDFAEGRLMIGMMWQSRKALDLLRDGRAVLHSVTTNKTGTDGDVKIYARAEHVADPALREAFRAAIKARIDWAPGEPTHIFEVQRRRSRLHHLRGREAADSGVGSGPATQMHDRTCLKLR